MNVDAVTAEGAPHVNSQSCPALSPQEAPGLDAGAPLPTPNLGPEHSIADRLLEVASLYQQTIKEKDRIIAEYARRDFELVREVKRLKSCKCPMSLDA